MFHDVLIEAESDIVKNAPFLIVWSEIIISDCLKCGQRLCEMYEIGNGINQSHVRSLVPGALVSVIKAMKLSDKLNSLFIMFYKKSL